MEKINPLGRSHQQLTTMMSEDLHQPGGLPCPGTIVFSWDCVILAIIMDIRPHIAEPMSEIEMHGTGVVMRTLGTKVRAMFSESDPLHPVEPIIDLEN